MRAGLRLDQGPPFSVPLRFFLTAPLFLAATGIGISLTWAEWTSGRWVPATLALTHLLALGFLAMVMLGAFTQLAPVAAGGPLPRVVGVARASHLLLTLGAPLLAWGLAGMQATALLAGAVAGGVALLVFLGAALAGLLRAPRGATRQAMLWALGCLLGLLVPGIGLAAWLAGGWIPEAVPALADSHVLLALAGWIGLLVIGAAYQVVPMLQVTPNYPSWMQRGLASGLGAALLLWLAATWSGWPAAVALTASAIGLGLAVFALGTLHLQYRRRRKVADVTLAYWRIGMIALLAACLLGVTLVWLPAAPPGGAELLLGLLFLLAFATSVVNGMLLKILPFLAWFHLQSQVGMRQTPLGNMKDFFPDAVARRQYRLHLAALACLLPAPWWAPMAVPGGLLLAGSAILLELQFLRACRLFRGLGGSFGSAQRL